MPSAKGAYAAGLAVCGANGGRRGRACRLEVLAARAVLLEDARGGLVAGGGLVLPLRARHAPVGLLVNWPTAGLRQNVVCWLIGQQQGCVSQRGRYVCPWTNEGCGGEEDSRWTPNALARARVTYFHEQKDMSSNACDCLIG